MVELAFTVVTSLFLVFYGLCLLGWPINVVRGIGWLERKSRRTRAAIGLALIAAGLAVIVAELTRFRG